MNDKAKPAKPAPAATPVRIPPPPEVPPLFRRIDWLTFGVTTLLVFLGYYLTLSPNLGLEDSGELAVGSFYAGVPHPPGYPVWTIYTWLFTVILPFSNIAWRVAMSSAVAGAFACGLLALIVSRGSSMMLEGIEEFKNVERRWENWICITAGFVAGMLLGFNGFVWSQAVIVEVYTFSLLSLMGVLACLLRWMYAPQQRRYLYWAFFLFGICFTNHQTLVVAAMGIEVAIAAAHPRLGRDLFFFNSVVYLLGIFAKNLGFITSFDSNLPLFVIYNCVGIGSLGACAWLAMETRGLLSEWKPMATVWVLAGLGAAFYFFMPISSATNPPMNWGYPRTWGGFVHAFTRGQYEATKPTDDPFKFFRQVAMYFDGAMEEFNFVNLLIAVVPFLFFFRMQKREKAWMIGSTAIYACLAFLLLLLLNPNTDRQSREQARVFFGASHVFIAMFVAYGMTLIAGLMATSYQTWRPWGIYAAAAAAGVALYARVSLESLFPLSRFTAWLGVLLAVAAAVVFILAREKAPLAMLLALFAISPAHSILSHWSDNEQRGHLFGYWFGHDMFTPPFTGPDGKFGDYGPKARDETMKDPVKSKLIYPEMARDAVLFGGTDPGRFCPTYMIFCEGSIPARCKQDTDPQFDRRDVYLITQNALADGTYLDYIRAHYNRSAQKDPYFFQDFFATMCEGLRSKTDRIRGTTNALAGMMTSLAKAALPLDKAIYDFGDRVEKRRRAEGVYPKSEIITPNTEDSGKSYQDYLVDAQRRMQLGQLDPGEDVSVVDNRMQVKGQVAVMAINGLLTKVIFDKNPTHEFYVEESFPLKWMYPHLTPFGIIMKINREPVAELSEEVVRRDREFWSQYSGRLVGNWVTPATTVEEVCKFAERVFLRRDFSGFQGDRAFVRDDVAQKSFSKLRNAIAGVYLWRLNNAKTPLEKQRMLAEADFAYRQCLAFCPYNLEAIYHYINLLLNVNRVDDALRIATMTRRFDEHNQSLDNLVNQLDQMKRGAAAMAPVQGQLAQLEQQYRSNPANVQTAFLLASAYLQMRQTNNAVQLLDQLITNPATDSNTLFSVANAFAQLGEVPRLERVLQKVVQVVPDNPEAWYDLAAIEAVLRQTPESVKALKQALKLSDKRLAQQPTARNLRDELGKDGRFNEVRADPEFLQLTAPK